MRGVAVLFTIAICTIGLVMSSPFGTFMCAEDIGKGCTFALAAQTTNEKIYMEYKKIKAGVPHNELEIT